MNLNGSKWNNEIVSVIMPAYYSESTIASAIESVMVQTYTNWELLIYDDYSGDRTSEISKQYAAGDNRIHVVSANENRGVASARNQAIDKATGRYISFLDSDDKWKPEKLEKQIAFIKKHECGMCYSSYELMDSSGKCTGKIINIRNEMADYKSLLKNNYIGTLTVVIDRRQIQNISFSSNRHEDYLLWLHLVKNGDKLLGLNESLAYYRVSGKSLSGNKIKAALWRWKVYYKLEKIGLIKSLFYMAAYTGNSVIKRI